MTDIPRRSHSRLRHVSEIITDILNDLPPEPRETVADALHGPYTPHRDCPCGRCMSEYLACVRGRV